MIKEKHIKPIPRHILKLIKDADSTSYYRFNKIRFYSYLTRYNRELARVIVAVRNKNNQWYCKQVVVHGVHTDKCYLKDIMFNRLCGYKVGWFSEGLQKEPKWYESDDWGYNDDIYFNIDCPMVNREYALKIKEYKYSAIDKASPDNSIKYLRLYEKYPQMELLVKLGLSFYATSKMILNKTTKDKKFCKWLIKNSKELSYRNYYYGTILLAYKLNKHFGQIQQYQENKKLFYKPNNFQSIKKLIDKSEYKKFIEYLGEQNASLESYKDYLDACNYLNLDMSLDKNRYPHNFKYWHDMRIDQYATQKALKDKQERKGLYKKFAKIAQKYLPLQRELKDDYCVIIAKSPGELIKEGATLNHCVGRMNYDQKFVREESLIFFVRNKDNPQKSFVTVEYSLKNNKVLQCYGKNDKRPDESVVNFVNEVWLPYANKQIRKVA